jgi:hypothetical protein
MFSGKEADLMEDDTTHLGALLSLNVICLLPMFTVLSCDYGRLEQYMVATAFLTLAIGTRQGVRGLFPSGILNRVQRINGGLIRFVRPSFGLSLLLLFFFADAASHYDFHHGLYQSIYGQCCAVLTKLFMHL